jgi:hypothetical protein
VTNAVAAADLGKVRKLLEDVASGLKDREQVLEGAPEVSPRVQRERPRQRVLDARLV